MHSQTQTYSLQTFTFHPLLHCPRNTLTLGELHFERGDENMSEKAIFYATEIVQHLHQLHLSEAIQLT